MYAITKNLIDDKPVSLAEQARAGRIICDSKDPWTFRLLDDDGEVYFEGVTTDILEHAELAFAPLDEIGSGYGCTEMQYLSKGKWVTL